MGWKLGSAVGLQARRSASLCALASVLVEELMAVPKAQGVARLRHAGDMRSPLGVLQGDPGLAGWIQIQQPAPVVSQSPRRVPETLDKPFHGSL